MSDELRIATFNLENLDDSAGAAVPIEARLRVLRPQLARLEADVLCLQEATPAIVAALKPKLPYVVTKLELLERDQPLSADEQGWGIRMIWGVAAPRFRPFFAHFPPSLARSLRLDARKPGSAKKRRKNGGKRAQNGLETGVSDPYIRMPQP